MALLDKRVRGLELDAENLNAKCPIAEADWEQQTTAKSLRVSSDMSQHAKRVLLCAHIGARLFLRRSGVILQGDGDEPRLGAARTPLSCVDRGSGQNGPRHKDRVGGPSVI